MQCQILYHTDGTKALQSMGFSDIDEANKWLNKEAHQNSSYVQNARIVVDYAAVEAFKEMYDLMKEQLFPVNGKKHQAQREKVTI